jgi:hypothetical protein
LIQDKILERKKQIAIMER